MMINNEINNLLLRSFDEDLKPGEKEKLEMALADSDELRKERDKLLNLRKLVSSASYSFDPGFKDKVMKRVEGEKGSILLRPDFNLALYSGFKKLAITGVAAIILMLLSIYITEGSFTGNDLTSDDNLISYFIYEDFNK